MKKKIITGLFIFTMVLSLNAYGASEMAADKGEVKKTTLEGLTLTIDEAVEKGLANSFSMSKVKNQVDLATLVTQNAETSKNDIYNGQNELSNAASDLSNGRTKAYNSMDQLDSAQVLLDSGISPVTIEGYIKVGDVVTQAQKAAIQAQLTAQRVQLNNGLEDLDEGMQKYFAGKSKYDLALEFGMTSVANKLSTSTISSLEPTPLADLIVNMAKIQDRVTSYSSNIYKNQIAMQIQNSYYNALKQLKLLESRDKALQRAKLQYEYADFAYSVGAKSKDDMIFAKLYYDGADMAYDLQLKEYNNAIIELEKNINIPLDTKIILVPAPSSKAKTFDLNQGITSGLSARLEMKMADAKVDLYEELRAAVIDSYYDEYDNEYKEAQLLLDKAQIEFNETKVQVESGIRMSYQTLVSMEKVLEKTKYLSENAQEALEIAKLKYEVGFGASNSLLKNLNLEDLSGTMVEVIAAEENLATIEGKVIEATNGYNLAKAKYLNDIGILPYK